MSYLQKSDSIFYLCRCGIFDLVSVWKTWTHAILFFCLWKGVIFLRFLPTQKNNMILYLLNTFAGSYHVQYECAWFSTGINKKGREIEREGNVQHFLNCNWKKMAPFELKNKIYLLTPKLYTNKVAALSYGQSNY